LTNNPDKIEKFTKLGFRLKNVESIEIEPNPFNQTYLVSKQLYGHILFQAKTKVQKYEIPYARI
jgi:GTP cyclohydrolase II